MEDIRSVHDRKGSSGGVCVNIVNELNLIVLSISSSTTFTSDLSICKHSSNDPLTIKELFSSTLGTISSSSNSCPCGNSTGKSTSKEFCSSGSTSSIGSNSH